MNTDYVLSGAYAIIVTLTILLGLANSTVIDSMPWDIKLGWSLVVFIGIIMSIYFLTRGD